MARETGNPIRGGGATPPAPMPSAPAAPMPTPMPVRRIGKPMRPTMRRQSR